MKRIVFFIVLLIAVTRLNGQELAALKAAIDDPQKKVQAIHHYPENIKKGECHFVEVIAVTVSGNNIVIVEEWTDWAGSKAKTTLTGTIANNKATGTWKSDFSKGNWSYNFSSNTGTWNKPKGYGTFEQWQKIDFRIVDNDAIKDDFLKCTVR